MNSWLGYQNPGKHALTSCSPSSATGVDRLQILGGHAISYAGCEGFTGLNCPMPLLRLLLQKIPERTFVLRIGLG